MVAPIWEGNGKFALAEWQASMREKFAALRRLEPGGDGRGSAAISDRAISRAAHSLETALLELPEIKVPAIVPVGDGGAQVEWHIAQGDFEMYFYPDGHESAWLKDRASGREYEAEHLEARILLRRWTQQINAPADRRAFA